MIKNLLGMIEKKIDQITTVVGVISVIKECMSEQNPLLHLFLLEMENQRDFLCDARELIIKNCGDQHE